MIFITHNPHHAYPVTDRFVLLNRGRLMGPYGKHETSLDELTKMMAGGEELERLSRELEKMASDPEVKTVAKELAEEVRRPSDGAPT